MCEEINLMDLPKVSLAEYAAELKKRLAEAERERDEARAELAAIRRIRGGE